MNQERKEPLFLIPLDDQTRSIMKQELEKEPAGFEGKKIIFIHNWQGIWNLNPDDDNQNDQKKN